MSPRVAKRVTVQQLLAAAGPKANNREIARACGVSEGCVRYIRKRWGSSPTKDVPVDAPREGRPPKYSARCVLPLVLF